MGLPSKRLYDLLVLLPYQDRSQSKNKKVLLMSQLPVAQRNNYYV